MAYGKKPPQLDSLVIRAAITEGRIPRVWLWTGPEEFLKDELVELLISTVMPPGTESLNVSRFGPDNTLEEILNAAGTLPMMAERRVVIVRGFERLEIKSREAVAAHVATAGPETILLLIGGRGKGDVAYRGVLKAGAVQGHFDTPVRKDTVTWIARRFGHSGKRCPEEVATRLLDRCSGGDGYQVPISNIASEIEKIVLSLGTKETVGIEDLDAIGPKPDEELIGRLCNHVRDRNLPGALRALDGYLMVRPRSEVYVVIRLMYVARNAARNRPAGRRGLAALAAADRTLKSSPKNPRVVLERAVAVLCS